MEAMLCLIGRVMAKVARLAFVFTFLLLERLYAALTVISANVAGTVRHNKKYTTMADRDSMVVEFQNCTGVDDLGECIAILEQHDWNLQEAVQTMLAGFDSPRHERAPSPPAPQEGGAGVGGPQPGFLDDFLVAGRGLPPSGGLAGPGGLSAFGSGLTGVLQNLQPIANPSLVDNLYDDYAAFGGDLDDLGFPLRPSTSGEAGGAPTPALRLLNFDIQYRDKLVHLVLHDHENVGQLKEILRLETGVPVNKQELHGWLRKNDSLIKDTDILRGLKLPKDNTLYLLTPDLPQTRDDATPEKTAAEDLASRMYELRVCHRLSDASETTYMLKYPAAKTIREVKSDVFSLIDVYVRYQVWSGWPAVSDSATLGASGISYPIHDLSVTSSQPIASCSTDHSLTRPPLHSGASSSKPGDEEMDVDSDDDMEHYEDILDTEEISSQPLKPLMPSACGSQLEAVESFCREFTLRYGEPHPAFYIGPLEDAIRDALQCKARERKLLAIYLHHDQSIQANVFCSQILCTEMTVEYLANNFLTWAWDLTHESNRNILLSLCTTHFGSVASNTVRTFEPDQLPLLLVISRNRGSNEVIQVIQGKATLDELMTHLVHSVEVCAPQKELDAQEEDERGARESMLAEQDAAYQESLAVDRAKMESRRAQEEEERRREREELRRLQDDHLEQQRAEELKLALRTSLANQLPDEPAADCAEPTTTIRIKCPEGPALCRRFLAAHPLSTLLDYITSRGFPVADYKVLTTFPRRDLNQIDASKSLLEHKLHPQETLILEKL